MPGACNFHVLLFHFTHQKLIESGADYHDCAQFADLIPTAGNRRREDIGRQFELNRERQITGQRQSDLDVIFELLSSKRTTKTVDGDDDTDGNHEGAGRFHREPQPLHQVFNSALHRFHEMRVWFEGTLQRNIPGRKIRLMKRGGWQSPSATMPSGDSSQPEN